ncbi:MAG: hypothetical protein QG599_2825 [Pseudomonadota bacterium]|nr:hypothetical protein [Pseudomonadota bacterium]
MKAIGCGLMGAGLSGLALMPLSGWAEKAGTELTIHRLETFRDRIDEIDARIVQAIADRLAVAREIGGVKRAAGLPVVDADREAVVIAQFVEKARAQGIPEATARTVIQSLIAAARSEQ